MNNRFLKWFLNEEDGQGLIEYALILALISLGVVALATEVGLQPKKFFEDLSNMLSDLT